MLLFILNIYKSPLLCFKGFRILHIVVVSRKFLSLLERVGEGETGKTAPPKTMPFETEDHADMA